VERGWAGFNKKTRRHKGEKEKGRRDFKSSKEQKQKNRIRRIGKDTWDRFKHLIFKTIGILLNLKCKPVLPDPCCLVFCFIS